MQRIAGQIERHDIADGERFYFANSYDAVPDAAPYLAGALLLFWLGRRQLRRADLLDPPTDG